MKTITAHRNPIDPTVNELFYVTRYKKNGEIQDRNLMELDTTDLKGSVREGRILNNGGLTFVRWILKTKIYGNMEIGFYTFLTNNTRLTAEIIPVNKLKELERSA